MTSENVALFSQRCCMFWRNYFTHVCHHGMPYFQYNIYIYTYCIVYIRAFWFEIVISNSVRLYLLRSFPRDAALFCASCSTRTHNILFKEYHALRTTTIVQKSDIAYIRGFLFEMGEAFYSNAIPAFFCMLAYVEGLSTSNIELLWRILAEQRHVLVTSMYRCIPATSWNQEPRLQTTLLLLVLVVNARPHICWTMPHASYIIFGILSQLIILRIVPVTLLECIYIFNVTMIWYVF